MKVSLREFCAKNDLDPGNISKLERGILKPPRGARLAEYAEMLGLESESDDWYRFYDLAAAAAYRVPDYLSEEDVLEHLPRFCKALREAKRSNPAENLDGFKEVIRESWSTR